jgi:hypothetical protein
MANDPQAEADYFLRQVNWQPGDLVVLDWEGYDPRQHERAQGDAGCAYKDAWLKYVKSSAPAQPGRRVRQHVDYWRNVDSDRLLPATSCGSPPPTAQPATPASRRLAVPPVQRIRRPSTSDYCHLDAAALRAWALGNQTPEDDMPLSDDDKKAVATAVWDGYSMDDPTKPGVQYTRIKSVLWFAAANAASARHRRCGDRQEGQRPRSHGRRAPDHRPDAGAGHGHRERGRRRPGQAPRKLKESTMKIFGREPALVLGLFAAAVKLVSAFWLHTSINQQALVNTVAAAAVALIIAFQVHDGAGAAFLGFTQAAIAAAVGFGLHWSPDNQAVVFAFVSAAVAAYTRTQVTAPVPAPAISRPTAI